MYMAISMDSLGKEVLRCMFEEYILHYYIRYKEISMDPFCYKITFILHDCYRYMKISMDPFGQ